MGLQLQNGHLFFSHAELAGFWEAAGNAAGELSEEASSLLAASEEGLELLEVGGFFGALPAAADNGLRKAPPQPLGAAATAAVQGGGRVTARGGQQEDRGRWMQEAESRLRGRQAALPAQDGAEGDAQRKEPQEAEQGRPLQGAAGDRQRKPQAGSHAGARPPVAALERRHMSSGSLDESPQLPPHLRGGAAAAARAAEAGGAASRWAAQPVTAPEQRAPQLAQRAQHAEQARGALPEPLRRPQEPQQHARAGGRVASAGSPKASPAPVSAAQHVAGKPALPSRHGGSMRSTEHAAGAVQHQGRATGNGFRDSRHAADGAQAGAAFVGTGQDPSPLHEGACLGVCCIKANCGALWQGACLSASPPGCAGARQPRPQPLVVAVSLPDGHDAAGYAARSQNGRPGEQRIFGGEACSPRQTHAGDMLPPHLSKKAFPAPKAGRNTSTGFD